MLKKIICFLVMLLCASIVLAADTAVATSTTNPASSLATPDRDYLLYAVSAAGSRPFSRQAIDRMTEVIAHHSQKNLDKNNIKFTQTAVTKDADGKNDIVIALFRIDKDGTARSALLNDAALVTTLDREIGNVLKGYSDVRTTFASETIPGTCFNGVKDGDEVAVDCGGECLACKEGSVCSDSADCASGRCVNGKCGGLRNGATVATIAGALFAVAAAGVALL